MNIFHLRVLALHFLPCLLLACGGSDIPSVDCTAGQGKGTSDGCGAGGEANGVPAKSTGQFTLKASNTPFGLERGESKTMAITIERTAGFVDPVTVTVEGLPSAVTTTPMTGAEGSTAVTVTLRALANATPSGLLPVTVKGTAGSATATASLPLYVKGNSGEVDGTYPAGGADALQENGLVRIRPLELPADARGPKGLGVDGVLPTKDDGFFLVGSTRGVASVYDTSSVLLKIDGHGLLDPSFAKKGYVAVDFPGFDGYPKLLQTNDHGILVYGSTSYNTTSPSRGALAQLDPNGELSKPLGTVRPAGIGTENLELPDVPAEVVPTKDGRFVFVKDSEIYLLKADGSPDPSFGLDGKLVIAKEPFAADLLLQGFVPTAVAVTNDNQLVVAGNNVLSFREDIKTSTLTRTLWVDPTVAVVLRLSLAGRLDRTFGDAGATTLSEAHDRSFRSVVSMALDANDRLYVTGESGLPLASFPAPDTRLTLNSQTGVTMREPTDYASAYGDASDAQFLFRLTATGKPDLAFGRDAAVTVRKDRLANQLPLLAVDASGRALFAIGQDRAASTRPTKDPASQCGTAVIRFSETGGEETAFDATRLAFVAVDDDRLPGKKDCKITLRGLFVSSLNRTTIVGTATSGNVAYPLLARFWN